MDTPVVGLVVGGEREVPVVVERGFCRLSDQHYSIAREMSYKHIWILCTEECQFTGRDGEALRHGVLLELCRTIGPPEFRRRSLLAVRHQGYRRLPWPNIPQIGLRTILLRHPRRRRFGQETRVVPR